MSVDSEKVLDIKISMIKCKSCLKFFRSNAILKHLRTSITKKCIEKYNDEELASLRNNSIHLSKIKGEIWRGTHKDQIKQRKARWYQENQDDISRKQLTYNQKDDVKAKRSQRDRERYLKNKAKKIKQSQPNLIEKIEDKLQPNLVEKIVESQPKLLKKFINAELIPDDVICKGCNFVYETNSILMHLGRKSNRACKKMYSEKELNILKEKSKNFTMQKAMLRTKAQEKLKYKKDRENILKRKKEYYIENKEKIKKYKKEKYAKEKEEFETKEREKLKAAQKVEEYIDPIKESIWKVRNQKRGRPKTFLLLLGFNRERLERWLPNFGRFRKKVSDIEDVHNKFIRDIEGWLDYYKDLLDSELLKLENITGDKTNDYDLVWKTFDTLEKNMESRAKEIESDIVNSLDNLSKSCGLKVYCYACSKPGTARQNLCQDCRLKKQINIDDK